VIAALYAAAVSIAAPVNSARSVSVNTVISHRDPHVRVVVPKTARYVGTDRFILYGIAHCEFFAFVQADAHTRVQRMYWIQFEGYLSSLPKLQHTYNSPRHAGIGGLHFYVDTWTEPTLPRPPNLTDLKAALAAKGYTLPAAADMRSDYEHVYALLRNHGYTLPERMVSVRLVHLLDDKRKELMIIYSEAAPQNRPVDTNAVIRRAEASVFLSP
jgi:hypothetical protein